jgi:hypothetical protein
MWILTIEGVLLDGPKDTLNILVLYSYTLTGCFLFFIAIANFTLINMLIGIICNVVDSVQQKSKEEHEQESLKNALVEFLEVHDEDCDRRLQEQEFDVMLTNGMIKNILRKFGVDVRDLKRLKKSIFELPQEAGENTGEKVENKKTKAKHANTSLTIAINGDKENEGETQAMPFSTFLRTVKRLRGTNAAQVSDVVDLRDFIRAALMGLGDFMRNTVGPSRPNTQGYTKHVRINEAGEASETIEPVDTSQSAVCTSVPDPRRADLSPLRQEAIGGNEQLASRQLQLETRQLALEAELARSREQLGGQLNDVQKQLQHLCSMVEADRSVYRLPNQVHSGRTASIDAAPDDEDC